mgnify:CR=1 FL=1
MIRKRYIGIDLHTDNFFACFRDKEDELFSKKYELSQEGFREFIADLSPYDIIAVEAVANAPFFKRKILGYVEKIVFVAPGEFHVIGSSYKKTDLNDAGKLAFYLSKGLLPLAREKSEFHSQLLSMIETRSVLVKARMMANHKTISILTRQGIKLSSHRLIYKGGYQKYVFIHPLDSLMMLELGWLETQVEFLNQKIAEVNRQIEEMAQSLKGFKNLTSITGVGVISAAIILCTIGDIHDFSSPKKLASYFGLVPKVRRSNKNNPTYRITKRGSKLARTAIITSVWQVIRYNDELKTYYDRKREFKGGKRAAVATANKLIKVIFDVLKNDCIFEDVSRQRFKKEATAFDFA